MLELDWDGGGKRRRFAPCINGADAQPPHCEEDVRCVRMYPHIPRFSLGSGIRAMAAGAKGKRKDAPEGGSAAEDPRRVLKGTSLELPAYVWDQARAYLNDKPDMRFRHMVMAGFRALGLEIDDEDLIAERKRGPAG